MEFERDLSFSLFTVLDVVSLSQVYFAIFPMDKNIERIICLKSCIANRISCAESLKMLQKAYGESTLSKTRAFEWYSAFKSGRDVVKDLSRFGRPSTSSTEVYIIKVKEMVKDLNFLQKLNRVKAKNSMNIIEQPPYSPDMAPADFFLFPNIKLPFRGTRFQSIENIKGNSWQEPKSIPENAFEKCIDDWIIHWHKCTISGGAYFDTAFL